MKGKARSGADGALRLVRSLLALDPLDVESARSLAHRKEEILGLLDHLAAADCIVEACEVGLLLEQALEMSGEPTGIAGPHEPERGASRCFVIEHLLGIARAAGHAYYEGEMVLRQAELWLEHGDREQARTLYERAQRLSQESGITVLGITAISGLAEMARQEGNLFKAHGLYAKQRSLAKTLGEEVLESQALANLTATALVMGDHRRAARYARENLSICQRAGSEHGQAEALCGLGLAQRKLGEYAGSRRSYLIALRLSRALGDRWLEACVAHNLACLLSEYEPENAVALLRHVRDLSAEHGHLERITTGVAYSVQRDTPATGAIAALSKEAREAAERNARARIEALLSTSR